MELLDLLNRGRSGGAILFCGAGFSASCLGYEFDGTLGVGAHLLELLNKEISKAGKNGNFRQLPNAASQYKTIAGDNGLLALLNNKFTLSNVTEQMTEVIQYPWERVYTTNFDNGIELSYDRVPKKGLNFNNTEDPPVDLPKSSIIHLHGFVKKWDIHNFNASCILPSDSYARLPSVGKWLDNLRYDLERASAVVFVGFSASDFHLNNVFYNASGLREKAVFVNRIASAIDPDTEVQQSQYGKPLYIGIEGLANSIRIALSSPQPPPIRLASFRHFEPSRPASTVPSVQSIQNLLTLGVIERAQAARDISSSKSDFHVRRDALAWFSQQTSNGGHIFLLSGEVCDGKSMVVEDIAQQLSETIPVFWLVNAYDDLLDEVARILNRHPDAALVIENCFELRPERLILLARAFDGSAGLLLLTARSIAADAETGKVKSLKPLAGFRELRLSVLSENEIVVLERLIDQFGGFAHLGSMNRTERERYIRQRCSASLPAVLLDILRSTHVRDRYREQVNSIDAKGTSASDALVGCLFLKHIGDPPPQSFVSNIFMVDVADVIARANRGNGSFHLLRVERGLIQTVPAIGASLILREFFSDKDIVSVVVRMLETMAEKGLRSTEYERHVFSQLMRYSRLSTVVQDRFQIERFFDHISKIAYFREEPLFWLQWHMAKVVDGEFSDAERLLDRGYAEAGNWEKRRKSPYNLKQLDDRKAKFLMMRAANTERRADELFRDLLAACQIVERLLNNVDITHHPFETFSEITKLLTNKGGLMILEQKEIILNRCRSFRERAERRLPDVAEGYQQQAAIRAFENSKGLLS